MVKLSKAVLCGTAVSMLLASCSGKALFELLVNSKEEASYDCRADIEELMSGGEDLVDAEDQTVPVGAAWESCSAEKGTYCFQGTTKEEKSFSFGFLGSQRKSYGFPGERLRGTIGDVQYDLAVVYNSWEEISPGVWAIEYYGQFVYIDLVWDATNGKAVGALSAGLYDDGVLDYTSKYRGVFNEKRFVFDLSATGRTGTLNFDGKESTLFLLESTSYESINKIQNPRGRFSFVSTLDRVEARCSDGFRLDFDRNFTIDGGQIEGFYEASMFSRFDYPVSDGDEEPTE